VRIQYLDDWTGLFSMVLLAVRYRCFLAMCLQLTFPSEVGGGKMP
jgi:hypothetical protein